jgi:hypothetical protein
MEYHSGFHTHQSNFQHHNQDQATRFVARLKTEVSDIAKYLSLSNLQDRNENLFYRVIIENIKELGIFTYKITN